MNRVITAIFIIIILIEIVYLLKNMDTFYLNNYEIYNIFGGYEFYKLYVVIIIIAIICFCFFIAHIFKINKIIFFVFLIVSFYIYIEHVMKRNVGLTKKTVSINNLLKNCRTGDIIFYDTPFLMENIFYVIPVMFCGMNHMGIIIKNDEEEPYLLECDYRYSYCNFSKKEKTGVILFKLDERIRFQPSDKKVGTMFYLKNNLHKYLDNSNVFNIINKYKDVSYMENNLNCISFTLLFFQELNLLKNTFSNIPLYVDYKKFLDSSFYGIDYTQELYEIEK